MPNEISGPHLVCAFLCESVLQENNGKFTFVRLVERVFVNGQTDHMSPTPVQSHLVIAFKAGGLPVGKYPVRLAIVKPDGGILNLNEIPVLFDGGEDRGAMIASPFGFIADEEGLYWIDVSFDKTLVTRIALRVLYTRIGGPMIPGQFGG